MQGMEIKESLKVTLSSLPDSPGVYQYYDKEGEILYVGKARSLRGRVKSYFLESRWLDAKTGSLVREITDPDADRVIVLSDGTVTEEGSPAELIQMEGWFSQFAAAAEDVAHAQARVHFRGRPRLASTGPRESMEHRKRPASLSASLRSGPGGSKRARSSASAARIS